MLNKCARPLWKSAQGRAVLGNGMEIRILNESASHEILNESAQGRADLPPTQNADRLSLLSHRLRLAWNPLEHLGFPAQSLTETFDTLSRVSFSREHQGKKKKKILMKNPLTE